MNYSENGKKRRVGKDFSRRISRYASALDENKKDSLRVIKSVTAASPRRWSDRYTSRIVLNRVGLGYP